MSESRPSKTRSLVNMLRFGGGGKGLVYCCVLCIQLHSLLNTYKYTPFTTYMAYNSVSFVRFHKYSSWETKYFYFLQALPTSRTSQQICSGTSLEKKCQGPNSSHPNFSDQKHGNRCSHLKNFTVPKTAKLPD